MAAGSPAAPAPTITHSASIFSTVASGRYRGRALADMSGCARNMQDGRRGCEPDAGRLTPTEHPIYRGGLKGALLLPLLVKACAFSVHVFTSAGAALALAALFYAAAAQWTAMFLCLGIALIVDW